MSTPVQRLGEVDLELRPLVPRRLGRDWVIGKLSTEANDRDAKHWQRSLVLLRVRVGGAGSYQWNGAVGVATSCSGLSRSAVRVSQQLVDPIVHSVRGFAEVLHGAVDGVVIGPVRERDMTVQPLGERGRLYARAFRDGGSGLPKVT